MATLAEEKAKCCFARFKGGILHGTEKRFVQPAPTILTILDAATGDWSNYTMVECDYGSKNESERFAVYESADWFEDESQDEQAAESTPQPSVQA